MTRGRSTAMGFGGGGFTGFGSGCQNGTLGERLRLYVEAIFHNA
jgi:hypothetical protein